MQLAICYFGNEIIKKFYSTLFHNLMTTQLWVWDYCTDGFSQCTRAVTTYYNIATDH